MNSAAICNTCHHGQMFQHFNINLFDPCNSSHVGPLLSPPYMWGNLTGEFWNSDLQPLLVSQSSCSNRQEFKEVWLLFFLSHVWDQE